MHKIMINYLYKLSCLCNLENTLANWQNQFYIICNNIGSFIWTSEMGIISAKDISDGHHTFREIYKERLILFCVICNIFPELS